MDWSSQSEQILKSLWGSVSQFNFVDLSDQIVEQETDKGICIALDRAGVQSNCDVSRYDIALTTSASASRPWVCVSEFELDSTIATLSEAFDRCPVAANAARAVFRAGVQLPFDDALNLESVTYSMLLASAEFDAWRSANPALTKEDPGDRVETRWSEDGWQIELVRPRVRNAFDAKMRDALTDVLESLEADPNNQPIELRGAGPAFSAGGDLAEFGQAADPGLAHIIRVTRSPARRIHLMRERITARLHGACIGAGIEIPAAAGHIIADPNTRIQLPEIGMGLIPGAGGCVTIPRRIGRHRAFFLALSGQTIDAATAKSWGLIDEVARFSS